MRLPRALRACLLPALAALSVSAFGGAARADNARPVAMPIERTVLDNGLELVLHEDHRTPVVAVNVWYHVGSKDEPAGKNGFAHLFEHLMFQGSKNVGEDLFFKYLERAGASSVNGSTNLDRTNYFETVPANELGLALWLESDRMGFLLDHVDQKTFESQRDVVKNERRQNYENAPYGLVPQFVRAALYPESDPYHLLTIGTPHDLDAASLDDVRAFFRTFYVPNNATLVLAGDFDSAKAKELVKKYFGPIPRGATPPVKSTPSTATLTQEVRIEVEADVELPRVVFSWTTPAFYAPGDADLDIVSSVLSAGKSSRLYKRLVYDLEIAQDVSANQESHLLGSVFEISVTLKKGKKPEEVVKLVDDELGKLRSKEPTVGEIARAETRVRADKIFSVEGMGARAELFNNYRYFAGNPDYFAKDMERHEKVSAADVKNAVLKWLPKEKRVLTVIVPTPGAPRAGKVARSTAVGAPAAKGAP